MAPLARKITQAKWSAGPGPQPGEIQADAITCDLRTMGNTLSFWRLRGLGEDDLKEAALILASGLDRADRIDFAWIDAEELRSQGVEAKDTPGQTPVESLRDRHVDLVRLDLVRLGTTARVLDSAIQKKQLMRFTRKAVIEILVAGVQRGLLQLSALKDKLRAEVAAAMPTPPP